MKIAFLATAALGAPAALAFAPASLGRHAPRHSSSNEAPVQAQLPAAFAPRTTTPAPALSMYINIQESAPRDLGAMDEWATSCGVQRSDGFQLTTEDGLDYSVMTTQDLPEGSPVLSVPANMILSTSGAWQELHQGISAGEDFLKRMGAGDQVAQFYLFVKILVEYEKGEESPYYPWLNAMPRLYYNAVSMTDFCYECLPPLVFRLARTERVKFDNLYEALNKFDGVVTDMTKVNRELCKWAFNVVYTRSVGPDGGDKQIVPMADMFNHGTETEVAMSIDDEGNCNVYTTTDVPAGSPLRISYGDPTNPSLFFATYGFLDETSPATFCKMMNIQPTPQHYDMGYGFDTMLFYKDTGDISEQVYDVVLYDNLGKKDRDAQQALYDAHMRGDVATKQAIHQEYYLDTVTSLKNHVDTFLEQLDSLSNKAVGKDPNEHPRLPLILRHNDFVRSTFYKVKDQLDPMYAEAAGEPVYS